MSRPSAREAVLDAYERILLEHGPAAVTLEGVAANAGVSKGGLLYHFDTKDALLVGLLHRLVSYNDADIEHARSREEGVVRYYLESSVSDVAQDSKLHRSTLAAIGMVRADPRVSEAMRACTDAWRTELAEHIDDPLAVELVSALGDALYLRAAVGEDSPELSRDWDAVIARLGA